MTETAEVPVAPSLGVPPPLEVGSRVGSFELRRLIAQGSCTAVYMAQDTTLGVDVAIKEFRLARGAARHASAGSPTHVQLEPAVERGLRAFVEEARMLARCDHPSLMAVRGLFETGGTAYRVMPFYTATGLTELRASMPRPPDEPSVRAVLHHLLGALEALHAHGQAHGALVASKVLLLPDDRPLLLGPGSAAREAAFVRAAAHAREHPGEAPPLFADKVSGELRDLADLAEFCIIGVPRPAGHLREAGDTVTASIVRELGAVELRHYSPAFLSVLDVASSARSEDRPINTAQFANWLGSHELRRLKQRPQASLQAELATKANQEEWVNTVPPAMWIEPASDVATPSPAERENALPQDSISSSQVWADTVQVADGNPPPAKRTTVYSPLPMPQARPNFEQRRWEARKWMAGLGVAGAGLLAVLVYVVGGTKAAALTSSAGAAANTSAGAVKTGSPVVAIPLAPKAAATTAMSSPATRAVPSDKPTPATVAAEPTEMPEIRLPVAAPFSAASAASAASLPGAAVAAAVVAAATVAAVAAVPRAEPAVAKLEPKTPAASRPPKGVKMSKAAWANGPRGVCSARTGPPASSCLKTQCRTRQWAPHPQCARAVVAKSAG